MTWKTFAFHCIFSGKNFWTSLNIGSLLFINEIPVFLNEKYDNFNA